MKKKMLAVSVVALGLAACGGNKAANNQSANASAPNSQASNTQVNASAPTAAAGTITPQEVRAMIERDGASATVQTLYQGGTEAAPSRLSVAMQGIARGEQAWLDIVPLLREGVDGETGESLSMSLGDALPINAAGVLRVGGGVEEVPSFCDPVAFSELDAERRAYRDRAVAAVEAVSDPALQQVKAACLTTLRSTR